MTIQEFHEKKFQERDLHIIALNVPFPPDYGGVIGTFYRIRALKDEGIRIHLHCFEYGRGHPGELSSLCATINYYRRSRSVFNLFSRLPYIVSTRRSVSLLKNLVRDKYPVFFDGLHTTYYLGHPLLADRKKTVRLNNIEHEYYYSLAVSERNIFKKIYYFIESKKLKRYEKILSRADNLLAVSGKDLEYFRKKFRDCELIHPFHPFSDITSTPGSGDYILYHGDLSVNENRIVAEFLIRNVFSRVPYRCIIAGKQPSSRLATLVKRHDNISIAPDTGGEEMIRLIKNAHVNVLFSLNDSGFKIKLLYSLFAGRFCIINSPMAASTNLGSLCRLADTAESILHEIHELWRVPFSEEAIAGRRMAMSPSFDNRANAGRIAGIVFPGK